MYVRAYVRTYVRTYVHAVPYRTYRTYVRTYVRFCGCPPPGLGPDSRGYVTWSPCCSSSRRTFVVDECSSSTNVRRRRTCVVDERSSSTNVRRRRTFVVDERSSLTNVRRRPKHPPKVNDLWRWRQQQKFKIQRGWDVRFKLDFMRGSTLI